MQVLWIATALLSALAMAQDNVQGHAPTQKHTIKVTGGGNGENWVCFTKCEILSDAMTCNEAAECMAIADVEQAGNAIKQLSEDVKSCKPQ